MGNKKIKYKFKDTFRTDIKSDRVEKEKITISCGKHIA